MEEFGGSSGSGGERAGNVGEGKKPLELMFRKIAIQALVFVSLINTLLGFVSVGEMTLEDELRYTKSYVPIISNEKYLPNKLRPFIQNLKCRSIQEGRLENALTLMIHLSTL
nr:hypothetical protein [Tanacetum cinerariifolium]